MDIQCINISYVKHDIILIRPALFPAQAVSNIFDWTVCVFTLVVVLCCVGWCLFAWKRMWSWAGLESSLVSIPSRFQQFQ